MDYSSYSQPQQPQLEDAEEEGSSKTGLFIGLALVVVVAIVLVLIFRSAHQAPLTAPTSWVAFNASDGSFALQAPADWESSGSSAGAISSGALFKKGNAKIDVSSDLGGSLQGDMFQAQNNQMENLSTSGGVPLPPPPPPVERLHKQGEQAMAEKYKSYAEGDMQTFTCNLGPARFSEFTADGGMFVGKIHGYRATVLSTERQVTVIEVCADSDWATLQPAFQKVLASLDHGKSQ